jgi:hypothetical protein
VIAALVLAAALASPPARCGPPARIARIHLVDGMPFVVALRPSLRARTRPDATRPGAHAFVLYDGTRLLATLRFDADGSVGINGSVRAASAGTVDVLTAAGSCPIAASHVVLAPG